MSKTLAHRVISLEKRVAALQSKRSVRQCAKAVDIYAALSYDVTPEQIKKAIAEMKKNKNAIQ